MALDRNTLLNEVNCITCGGVSITDSIIIALLQRIAEQTLSNGIALDVTGDPNGVLVSDHNQFAWDSTNKVLWVNEGVDGSTGPWHQIV